jgi:tetratricopeptide (TPR) repeat protein
MASPRVALYATAIVIAGALVYANSLTGPFVFDDKLSIVINDSLREWWHLGPILFPERELPVAGRPVVNASFAINYAFGGLAVRGYHLVNIALHVGSALLIFGLVRRALQWRPQSKNGGNGARAAALAFGSALLWEVHPLNTEAVNYLTQRTELLMGLCYLGTIYASFRAARSVRSPAWECVAVVACAAGMASKESMATAPLMVVLFDRLWLFDSTRSAIEARWRLYLGLAATWLLLIALTWSGPRAHSAGFSTGVSPWSYLLNQAVMIVRYLQLAVWPRSLVLNYGWPQPLTLIDVWPSALVIVVGLGLTIFTAIRYSPLSVPGVWFFLTLAPTSSVVPIATEVGAERRMYLPLVSIVVLAVMLVGWLWDRVTRASEGRPGVPARTAAWAGGLGLLLTAAPLAAATTARNREYSSSLVLAQTVVDRHPTSVAHHLLAAELIGVGRHEEALGHLRQALPGAPRAHYTLGVELFNQGGDLTEAIAELRAFLQAEPLLIEALTARQVLGHALAKQQRWSEAIEQYRLLLTMPLPSAQRAEVQGLLAEGLFGQHAFEAAIPQYRAYLDSHPRDVSALTNLAIALNLSGRLEEALVVFRRTVEIDPHNGGAQHNLASALFDHHEVDDAVVHASQFVALQPADPAAHDLLGRFLAVQGNLAEAAAQFEEAIKIDPTDTQSREDLRRVSSLNRPISPARR